MLFRRKLFLPLATVSLLFTACDSGNDLNENTEIVITELKVGDGEEIQVQQTIIIEWEGKLPDGTVFDSSELQGEDLIFTLGVGKLITGLDEGIQGMRVGGQRRIEIPPQKAFGRVGSCTGDGSCPVPGNTIVTYEVEVLSIMTEVAIEILQEGNGVAADSLDLLVVEYVGVTQSGTLFDSSDIRGGPFQFRLGENFVIQGWERGIIGMKTGGVRILTIPPVLGYGANPKGSIPAWSVLIFRIELVAIVDES